ncbi:hypothetical protein PG994_005157 [Apiospora phragmitis]|uniref:Uncharacterized protein n=1 Tax=Apiospora phragmitis TaxID=2905665 RepID=A0ABR1VSP3_9PEZI
MHIGCFPAILAVLATTQVQPVASLPRRYDNENDDPVEPTTPNCADLAAKTPCWALTNGRWTTIGGGANTIWFRENEMLLSIRSTLACEGVAAGEDYDDLSSITIEASTGLLPASAARCAASLTLFGFRYECYISSVSVPPEAGKLGTGSFIQ